MIGDEDLGASRVGFAYGSNLSRERLRRRAPSARFLGSARLRGYELRFHKRGADGSGKADVFRTDRPEDVVWGALFEIDGRHKDDLDRYEDLGRSYREARLPVRTPDDGVVRAFTYLALPSAIEPGLKPFAWYRAFLVRGARERGLPTEWIEALESVEVKQDPDAERARRNRRILEGGHAHRSPRPRGGEGWEEPG